MEYKLLQLMTGTETQFLDGDSLGDRVSEVDRTKRVKIYKRGPIALAEQRQTIYERRLEELADQPALRDVVIEHTEGRELMLEDFDQAVRALRLEAIRQITPETLEPLSDYL